MKIKIKSREEIEKTLDWNHYHIRDHRAWVVPNMFKLCGQVLEAEDYIGSNNYKKVTNKDGQRWCWHPDWYEVAEDFTDEDLMDIEFMDEMLGYFLEFK